MATKPLPTIQQLRQLLAYNPATGALTWLHRPPSMFNEGKRAPVTMAKIWNSAWAGKPALTNVNASGYHRGAVMGVGLLAHRVAFAIYHGKWPDGEIDHINGDPKDNRIANLRDASRVANGKNLKMKVTNTSGFVGVTFDKLASKWRAQATHEGQHFYIGIYDDVVAAAHARDDFHRNLDAQGCVFNFPNPGEQGVRPQ